MGCGEKKRGVGEIRGVVSIFEGATSPSLVS